MRRLPLAAALPRAAPSRRPSVVHRGRDPTPSPGTGAARASDVDRGGSDGLPIAFKPSRGSRETYARIAEQARLQHRQRIEGRPVHELLEIVEGQGLARLPEPSPGDLFLDLEGARFARDGGREYLFGLWAGGASEAGEADGGWAFTDDEERAAFEATIDAIMAAVVRRSGPARLSLRPLRADRAEEADGPPRDAR